MQKEQISPFGTSTCPGKDCQCPCSKALSPVPSLVTGSANALALLFPDAGMHRFGTCQISLMVTKCLVSVI